jgi:hypothetical protein
MHAITAPLIHDEKALHDEMLKTASGPDGGLNFQDEQIPTESLHVPREATIECKNARA